MIDLVARLTDAAAAAIANERRNLEHPAGHVAGVTIELMLSREGQVHEATCLVKRRTDGGMPDQTKPSTMVRITGEAVEVRCRFGGLQVFRESGSHPLPMLISRTVLAHERQCGKCDTEDAYRHGSPDFHKNLDEGQEVR